jgi:sterol desaturase/sphingolipid hydroxylase (fatty acid hydroxylase superfamily)
MSHEINAIWATHIVHHQSEEYNLTVALRQSWFQAFFSTLFYLPLAWIGFDPITTVTVIAFNTLYQFWIHTELIKNMGWFEWIFNTPSHHRVHHGSNPEYIDKNHGGTLIVWDRIFGTFQAEQVAPVYGITTPLRSWNPFHANFHYWNDLIQLSARASRATDKLKVFFAAPGWQPA